VGISATVEPASLGLRPGDEVLAVNGHPVEDVIDVQFYAAEDEVEIVYRRGGTQYALRTTRDPGQALVSNSPMSDRQVKMLYEGKV
jgi:S1-C subfamily serine protease